MTIGQVMKLWLNKIIPASRHTTAGWYRLIVQAVLIPAIGDLPVDQLTWAECCRRLRTFRRDQRPWAGEGLSPWSEEAARIVLAEAMTWAAEHDLIPAGIMIPPGGGPGGDYRHTNRPRPTRGSPG